MVKKSSISIAVISGSVIGIVLGLFVTDFDFNESPIDEKTIAIPDSQKQAEIEKTWVELEPINCYGNLCNVGWLSSYYNSSNLQTEPYLGNLQGVDFEHTTEFIKDYYKKRGVTVFDVMYNRIDHGNVASCEAGECWDNYKLAILVSNSDVKQMLDLGFKISEKSLEENLEKIDSEPKWKTYEVKGGSYHPENSIFRIPYKITNSKIESIRLDPSSASLVINLNETTSKGILEMSIPRNLIDATLPGAGDDSFFVLVNNDEVDFDETTKSSCFRNLLIEFPETAKEIEIIANFLDNPPISKVPDECIKETMKLP